MTSLLRAERSRGLPSGGSLTATARRSRSYRLWRAGSHRACLDLKRFFARQARSAVRAEPSPSAPGAAAISLPVLVRERRRELCRVIRHACYTISSGRSSRLPRQRGRVGHCGMHAPLLSLDRPGLMPSPQGISYAWMARSIWEITHRQAWTIASSSSTCAAAFLLRHPPNCRPTISGAACRSEPRQRNRPRNSAGSSGLVPGFRLTVLLSGGARAM